MFFKLVSEFLKDFVIHVILFWEMFLENSLARRFLFLKFMAEVSSFLTKTYLRQSLFPQGQQHVFVILLCHPKVSISRVIELLSPIPVINQRVIYSSSTLATDAHYLYQPCQPFLSRIVFIHLVNHLCFPTASLINFFLLLHLLHTRHTLSVSITVLYSCYQSQSSTFPIIHSYHLSAIDLQGPVQSFTRDLSLSFSLVTSHCQPPLSPTPVICLFFHLPLSYISCHPPVMQPLPAFHVIFPYHLSLPSIVYILLYPIHIFACQITC